MMAMQTWRLLGRLTTSALVLAACGEYESNPATGPIETKAEFPDSGERDTAAGEREASAIADGERGSEDTGVGTDADLGAAASATDDRDVTPGDGAEEDALDAGDEPTPGSSQDDALPQGDALDASAADDDAADDAANETLGDGAGGGTADGSVQESQGEGGSESAAEPDGGEGFVPSPVPAPAEPPEVWLRNCAPCHGDSGEGNPLGPELQHTPLELGFFVARNGRPFGEHPDYIVQAFPISEADVSDEELLLILAWLDTFPNPTTGAELYVDYCGHCHGVDGASGSAAFDIRLRADELAAAVRNGVEGDIASRTTYMPGWTAESLTDAEIQLISEHVSTL